MRLCCTLMIAAFFLAKGIAADPVPLATAHGKVAKVDKDHLAFQPRDSAGKFGKTLMLRLTGTSKITTLAPQTRNKKLVRCTYSIGRCWPRIKGYMTVLIGCTRPGITLYTVAKPMATGVG